MQRTRIGETLPVLPPDWIRHTVTVRDSDNFGTRTFIVFVLHEPHDEAHLNLAVRTYLQGRIFYGTLLVFRLSERMSFRLINMRAGDRALAMEAVARYVVSIYTYDLALIIVHDGFAAFLTRSLRTQRKLTRLPSSHPRGFH